MEWNPERARVEADARRTEHWSHWGPYLSDRQWGTVREDYSADGNAWSYLPFEHAHLRAYRWGEDGIFGICDDHQRLCFAPAFWNERDPILKERFFGLTNPQGNHGEDVKECYYFLDNVPSHSYMKALYKYPQRRFPYEDLVETNGRRTRLDPEYELVDTGVFADDAYFDIVVEYAKHAPSDILVRITATNRGASAAALHVIPQLWFRNDWSWKQGTPKPSIAPEKGLPGALLAEHQTLGKYRFSYGGDPKLLFTENETNVATLFASPSAQPYVKDGIGRAIVNGENGAANPAQSGSKLALQYAFTLPPGGSQTVRLRLAPVDDFEGDPAQAVGSGFNAIFESRLWEANRFYAELNQYPCDAEHKRIQRAAFAGMLWSKQFYNYVVSDWLHGDPAMPPPPEERCNGRNHEWLHLYNDDVLSMPDTWEYPWYAEWDLAFHTFTLAMVDPPFAKRQLVTLTREWYMHPDGKVPAYEWAFGDVNPPVIAWAAYRIFQIEHKMYGNADYLFLERVFHKLLLNFTWWVNREDPAGRNVFMGGFMGLDNIGVFDRGARLPDGGRILESDTTSWMAVFALDMLAIAMELAQHDPAYEDIASKFFEHFLYIAHAINSPEGGLWDPDEGFYFDQIEFPDGARLPLKVRSLVGVLPLLAVETLQPRVLEQLPNFARRMRWLIENRPQLRDNVADMETEGVASRRLLAVLNRERLGLILQRMFDEQEFLSPHGIRSLSKHHEKHPYVLRMGGAEFRVDYDPAESRSGLFGGNSNWRGPVWFPLNFLIIEALQNFHFYFGDEYRVEFPTGSGRKLTLWEAASELSHRLIGIFEPDQNGRRPFNGGTGLFAQSPLFRDLLLFYEYFNGDDGAGCGAAHQTGWTALAAKLIQQMSEYEGTGKSPLDWHYDAAPAARTFVNNEA